MALPFLSLICGILTALLGAECWLGLTFIIFGTIFYFYIISIKKNLPKYYRISAYNHIWIILWFLGIGNITCSLSKYSVPEEGELKNIRVAEGFIDDIKERAAGELISVKCIKLYNSDIRYIDNLHFKIIIYSDATKLKRGDRIIFPCHKMQRIANSENSFKTGYAEFMNRKGYYFTDKVSWTEIKKIGESHSLDRFSIDIRDRLIEKVEKLRLNKKTRYFFIAILTGDREYLNAETRQEFSDAGIAHILALSGFHITIIGGILLFLLFPLNFFGLYKLRYFFTVLTLWFYTLITGCSPSLVRACIMITVFVTAIILERKNTSLNSLCIAGFIILLFSPYSLFDIGFQLSFICVGALILFANRLNPIDYRRHPRIYNLAALLLATIVSTFASWILVAYYFQSVPTMFLPANLILLPLLPLYMVLFLIYLILSLFGIEILIFGNCLDLVFRWALDFINIFGKDFVIPLKVSIWPVITWYAGVVLLAVYFVKLKKKKIFIGATSLFILSFVLIYLFKPKLPNGIIVCNKNQEISVIVSNSEEERTVCFQSFSSSLFMHEKYKILVIDQDNIPTGLYSQNIIPDLIIVGGNYNGNLNNLSSLNKEATFVIHPSIQKERESTLLKEADSLLIRTHSLRKDKALKILF